MRPPSSATIAPDAESVETVTPRFPAVRRPALFQLRLHFVLKERIGIDEIGAEQLLTIGSHRASASSIISTLSTSCVAAAP
jgi:hypothetical protein